MSKLLAVLVTLSVLAVSVLAIAELKFTENGEEDILAHYFDALDQNSDNKANLKELSHFFARSYAHEVAEDQIKSLLLELDLNGNAELDREEFYQRYGAFFAPVSTNVPQQLHLALTGIKSEMRVTWVTRQAVIQPTVVYGTGQLDKHVIGSSATYQVGTFVPWVGWVHTAVMSGLQPNTRYFYQVGASDAPFSALRSFKTEPATPAPATIAFYGDMGSIMPFGFQVAFQIVQDNQVTPYDLVVHAGDIAYAGMGQTWEFEFLWDVLGRQIDSYASFIPYMTAVGNHEHYFNYTAFNTRFQMPSYTSGGYQNFWLSFDHSYVHWVFMSTEHPYEPGSEQYRWLEQDLQKANANRATVPWIFLVGHRPMYCSSTRDWPSHSPGGRFAAMIEPLMLKWGVDIYWSGHDHMYERTWPLINGTALTYPGNVYYKPGRPAYIVQGTAGAFIGEEFIQPRPSWSAFREQQYGYGRLTVNQTALHYEFLSANIEAVRDEFWLVRA